MLNILEVSKEELTTLNHGSNVFHDALEKVREGERRFHVTDPEGKVADSESPCKDRRNDQLSRNPENRRIRKPHPHDSLPCNAEKRHDGQGNRSGRFLLH